MSFDYDPKTATAELTASDTRMGELIERVGPFRMKTRSRLSTFQALLVSISAQQLSGKAAAAIHERLVELFPGDKPRPELMLAIPDKMLREAGLSRAKVASIKDLAVKTLDGTVPAVCAKLRRMDDEEIIARLTTVRGIGVWTVEMLLIAYLGRPDILPVIDLGIRKGYMIAYRKRKMPEPSALARYGRRWQPYRSVASWYLWEATRLPA